MKFYDDPVIEKQLFPFTLTRSAADIRLGITTIREKWMRYEEAAVDINIPSHLFPANDSIQHLKEGRAPEQTEGRSLTYPWQIFEFNDRFIKEDFVRLTTGRKSQTIPASNQVIAPENIFLEEGAKVEHSLLNASSGPIYIGKNAEIMEGCLIRGSFALCEGGVVKMGAKIYGATTIGPYSVVSGEIKNAVIFGYSNKAHDGYLGDAVLGEWCNLGAGTSNSNLKNTATNVKVWNPAAGKYLDAGLKCGLLMGDYSRSAINTSFNTGTVVGVCCNVFGQGLTPKYIPSFSWGFKNAEQYSLEKALSDIRNWKKFKNQLLSDQEINKLKAIFANL